LAVIDAHRGMGGFFPGEKDQFLMGENKMLRNQSKTCAGESQISAEETRFWGVSFCISAPII